MMYQDRLAVAIKVNGKVLREQGDTVFIPFGSEYSLLIKNMNSVRALVSIEVDGTDATENTRLIVPANDSIELERFIKSGNLEKGQRFKFIERTSKIEEGPRGIKAEDGLIRVEFEFEREPAKISTYYYVDPNPWKTKEVHHHHYRDSLLRDVRLGGISTGSPTFGDNYTISANAASSASFSASAASSEVHDGMATMSSTSAFMNSVNPDMQVRSAKRGDKLTKSAVKSKGLSQELNDKGITVGGSVSDQKFVTGSWFPTDGVKHVLIMKILGAVGDKRVTKAVDVKTKQECPTCGTKNKFGTKFCRECGTGLEQV